jgi:hypothetical protein
VNVSKISKERKGERVRERAEKERVRERTERERKRERAEGEKKKNARRILSRGASLSPPPTPLSLFLSKPRSSNLSSASLYW